jgi:hypothetical protein
MYNRNLGSKRSQGIVTPKTPKKKGGFFSRANYKKLQNIWQNNIRDAHKFGALEYDGLKNLHRFGMIGMEL